MANVTDAQAAEIMLTLPWQFGELNEDGEACYSDDEIQSIIGYIRKINARAEATEGRANAAEATVAELAPACAALLARAETAETEVARLREELDAESVILAEVCGQRDGCRAEVARLRKALKYVYDWLPGAVGSGAVYDKVMVAVGAALRGDSGQDAP